MSHLQTSIAAMTAANTTAKIFVGDHLHGVIHQTLSQLSDDGFPYEDALDMATRHVLLLQFLLLGKLEGENKIDLMVLNLTRNEEFAE